MCAEHGHRLLLDEPLPFLLRQLLVRERRLVVGQPPPEAATAKPVARFPGRPRGPAARPACGQSARFRSGPAAPGPRRRAPAGTWRGAVPIPPAAGGSTAGKSCRTTSSASRRLSSITGRRAAQNLAGDARRRRTAAGPAPPGVWLPAASSAAPSPSSRASGSRPAGSRRQTGGAEAYSTAPAQRLAGHVHRTSPTCSTCSASGIRNTGSPGSSGVCSASNCSRRSAAAPPVAGQRRHRLGGTNESAPRPSGHQAESPRPPSHRPTPIRIRGEACRMPRKRQAFQPDEWTGSQADVRTISPSATCLMRMSLNWTNIGGPACNCNARIPSARHLPFSLSVTSTVVKPLIFCTRWLPWAMIVNSFHCVVLDGRGTPFRRRSSRRRPISCRLR